ncbi:MAG: helicase-exonuclease AddAB subunit AddA [Clostridiaceae bacterium]|nr:helicase-exonuclease AddAB subunit AddA [Clostridiaceae bacterium]
MKSERTSDKTGFDKNAPDKNSVKLDKINYSSDPVDKAGPKWTDEQLSAIYARNCNLLVAAAAGAGKTAVLVERIIKRITDKKTPVDIDRILVVTFTNAAATEMRERISEAISRELDKNPENSYIRRQLNLLGKASITTIHSFCREVIQSHIQETDIDPGFRVADETESTLMRLEAVTELFEELYEEKHQDFSDLLESYGGNRDDQAIQDMVLNLYFFIQSNPWPEVWLEKMADLMDIPEGTDFSQTPWGYVIADTIRHELKGLVNKLNQAIEVLYGAEGLEKYIPVYQTDLKNISEILGFVEEIPEPSHKNACTDNKNYWSTLYDKLHSIEFQRLPNAGKNADKGKQQYVRNLRDEVKNTINKRFRQKLLSAVSDEVIKDIKALYPLMLCLSRLVRDFVRRYTEKKRKRSVLDFNDLEHLCIKILIDNTDGKIMPTKAALEYRERFDEIMVEEYQDSNMVQELILRIISREDKGEPNIFMVGDVKQSIYRFRQAKPELFMEKYNTYSPEKDSLYRKILLYKNFRSRKEIIDAVNYIFRQIMSARAGELDYTEKEALNPSAEYPENPDAGAYIGGPVELHLIETEDGNDAEAKEWEETDTGESDYQEEENDETEKLDNIQCEARLAGLRILELMKPDENGKVYNIYDKRKKEYRKLEYRDIVVLLRATKNWADVYVDELTNMGIPVFADTGTGFFKTIEVQVVLSMLQLIDNPLQDIPLLSVLRSPIFKFSADELSCIRITERKGHLLDALKLLAEKASDGKETEVTRKAAQKAAYFLEKLSLWREVASYMTTDQLIWHLYQDTGYYGMVGAMPEGEQRQANLRILYDRARQFEETSYKGLFNFINFVDKLKSSRGDMGSAKILGENDNVVRIMSIHKSKGLEFPVVILAGCGKQFNPMDMRKNILLHQELGFGPDVVLHRKRIAWPSAAKLGIREKLKTESISEEMRVLYVAMTRAREKLIITGSVKSLDKLVSRWAITASGKEDRLLDIDVLNARSYLDWLGPALIRYKPEDGGCANILQDLAASGYESEQNAKDPDSINNGFGFQAAKRDQPVPGSSVLSSEKKERLRLIETESKWLLRVWNRYDVSAAQITDTSLQKDFMEWLSDISLKPYETEYANEVNRRLSWKYPYELSSRVPAKVTVTEIKRRFDRELIGDADPMPVLVPALIKKPMFLEEKKGLSAAEAGSVLHFVMRHLDFKNPDIKAQIGRMVEKGLLTTVQAESVKIEKIRLFLESKTGKRMLASPKVKREVPFNMEIPCKEFYREMDDHLYKNETFLLQGIIDSFFEEPDGLVLLDYKTDYVPPGGIDSIKERYRIQIEYYARALETLTGKKVKGKYIYLFYNNETLEY